MELIWNVYIEDFNLIAVNASDFMERQVYASFEDNVSDSEIWDGQIYWSSHYNVNELSFTLATDGITDKQYIYSVNAIIVKLGR